MLHSKLKKLALHSSAIILVLILVSLCILGSTTLACHSRQEVSLQLQWVTQAQFAGYYVALDKGWYQDENIDLTIKPGGPDLPPVDLVASGKSQFGTSFLADLCVAIQKGKEVISIAQIQQKNGLLLIAKKSSDIEQPKDLIGKKVGVWVGSWEAQFDVLMANEGVSLEDIEIIPQGGSIDPFLKGDMDAASAMIYNEYQSVLESGLKAEDLNVIDYASYGLGFPGDVLFTSRNIAEKHPDLCARMLRATLRGWQYAIDNPEEAADIVLKYDTTGTLTRQHQISMVKEVSKLIQIPGRDMGYTDRTSTRQTIYILRQKILSGRLLPEDVYTNEFWDEIHRK
jgi:NitT/TauT family transport system substrate-binding protein